MANELFNTVAMPRVPRNNFDLSHEVKTSFDIGRLVPLPPIDCIPGDYLRITPEVMLRFAPLVAPVMHRVDAYVHYFFVPYRILWDGFEEFITNPVSGLVAPFVTLSTDNPFTDLPNSIGAYMGLPIDAMFAGQEINISPFAFAAYRKIYDEYYRDQNLVAEKYVPLVAGDNSTVYGPADDEADPPYLRSLEHDYFTSCLPFSQKGDPVTLPLTFQDNIPVVFDSALGQQQVRDGSGTLILSADLGSSAVGGNLVDLNTGPGAANIDPNGTFVVDVQSNAVTLETLRTAIVLQEFLERDARGGTRYIEKIQAHYGVRSSDARLQRPEYIGGTRQVFAISEVLSTAQSDNNPGLATQFVGQMAGHGISVGGGNSFSFKVEEFGCIIGIISVLPETAYQQGVHRSWIKSDPIADFAWPAFANLGEQLVSNKEVYIGSSQVDAEFGYQARYAEYKSFPSRVTGEFADSLSFWHLGQIFGSEPSLNESFIEADPTKFDRIFAVESSEASQIYARIVNRIYASRPLPRYGIPTFGSTSAAG